MLLKMEDSLNRRGNMPMKKATFYHKKRKSCNRMILKCMYMK